MKIYGNAELIKIRTEIDQHIKSFTSELNMVNNEYTPVFVRIKRRRSNIVYYTILSTFLIFFISFAWFLGILEAIYLILILYGISLLLTGSGLFFLRKVNREYRIVNKEWDRKYKEVLKHKDRINQLHAIGEVEVYKVICLTKYHDELELVKHDQEKYNSLFSERLETVKANIKNDLGNNLTSADIIDYYSQWGAKVTGQQDSSYDHLEVRRIQAARGKIEIGSNVETEDD